MVLGFLPDTREKKTKILVSSLPSEMSFSDLFVFLLVALSVTSLVSADSIHGCGGFVEASSTLIKARKGSDPKLDYSHITVELQTTDGLVKERTQCAPNGYYFIPVYDKGSFVVKVKGPDGWSWSPESVLVTVDHRGCNLNDDINFQFTGFLISGKVKGAIGGESCSAKDGGPSNVKIELLSPTGVVSSVLTSDAGIYSFTNIPPGRYQLRASHPNMDIKLLGSPEVELGFENVVADDIFFVSGYDVHGLVVSQGNPIVSVHVYLYSDDVLEIHCPQDLGDSPGRNNSLCHAISDPDGKFTFKSVPCGSYELLPYYRGENTVFDVSPSSVNISVEHHDVTISQKFQVTGFSVGGRVIDDNGIGVDKVKILVDGHPRGFTDNHGFYKLDQITSKQYLIEAEKDHYKFKSLNNFLVLPNMVAIPNIEVFAYDLCGLVHLVSPHQKAKVALTHGPENVKSQVKRADDDGRFCFEVLAGEYRLSAVSAKSEDSSSLIFSPLYHDIVVKSPVLNVEFFQAQVNIYGTIRCKNECGPSVSISLLASPSKGSKERKIFLEHESDDFVFSKVFPGKYQLEVKHNPSVATSIDDWCWKESVIDIEVGTEDKKGITFVQKGYWTDITSSHDVNVSILYPDNSIRNLQIKRGSQRVCIASPGRHELHFVDSCIFFGSPSIEFDTLNPSPIYLTGQKYLIKGEIHVPLTNDKFDLSNHLVVDVLNEEHVIVATTNTTLLHGSSPSKLSAYGYSVWSDLGEKLIFVPRDTRHSEGKQILFYPRERHVLVIHDGCQATVSPIIGRAGMYLQGSVTPAISDVNVRILAEENSDIAPLRKGELVLDVKTGADGSFIAGPLYDDTTYKVEASKPGYHLKSIGSNLFSCQKLGEILVKIRDGEDDELFPSVLLSLSGDNGYRNNTVSGAGGRFIFSDLFPGSFYLRPLLKEYSFTPSMQSIELGSGESKEIIFNAARVAYSVLGRVSLISGRPKEGVYLEARSESKGYYEETRSDFHGNYRLRGLLPHTTYTIKVVDKKNIGSLGIERTSPHSATVEVGMEDIRGVDFVVFEQPYVTILSGHVEGVDINKLQKHLLVEIKSASDPSKIESVFPLPISRYFEVRDLPKGKHLVHLVSRSPLAAYRLQSEVLEVDLEEKPQTHVGPLRYDIEEHHQKQDITPAPVFPLIVGMAVIAFFISIPRLKEVCQSAFRQAAFGSVPSSSKKEARKPVLRKRAY